MITDQDIFLNISCEDFVINIQPCDNIKFIGLYIRDYEKYDPMFMVNIYRDEEFCQIILSMNSPKILKISNPNFIISEHEKSQINYAMDNGVWEYIKIHMMNCRHNHIDNIMWDDCDNCKCNPKISDKHPDYMLI